MTQDVVALPQPDHKPFTWLLAIEIRGEMARNGMTQEDLARVLGVSQQAVSNRLNGKTPFDVNELELLAECFHTEPEALVHNAYRPSRRGDAPIPGEVNRGQRRRSSTSERTTITPTNDRWSDDRFTVRVAA